MPGQGLSVIMVSSEIPEIMGMADRVIVMREGRIAGRFDRAELTAEKLVRAAAGICGGRVMAKASEKSRNPAGRSPSCLAGGPDRAALPRLSSRPPISPASIMTPSILIILALGQMAVILTRCIDLSMAANLALCGMVAAMINAAFPELPIPLVVLAVVIAAGRHARLDQRPACLEARTFRRSSSRSAR